MNIFENLTFRQATLADSALLISMINEVYKKAEAEFWNDDYFRISEVAVSYTHLRAHET